MDSPLLLPEELAGSTARSSSHLSLSASTYVSMYGLESRRSYGSSNARPTDVAETHTRTTRSIRSEHLSSRAGSPPCARRMVLSGELETSPQPRTLDPVARARRFQRSSTPTAGVNGPPGWLPENSVPALREFVDAYMAGRGLSASLGSGDCYGVPPTRSSAQSRGACYDVPSPVPSHRSSWSPSPSRSLPSGGSWIGPTGRPVDRKSPLPIPPLQFPAPAGSPPLALPLASVRPSDARRSSAMAATTLNASGSPTLTQQWSNRHAAPLSPYRVWNPGASASMTTSTDGAGVDRTWQGRYSGMPADTTGAARRGGTVGTGAPRPSAPKLALVKGIVPWVGRTSPEYLAEFKIDTLA